MMSRTKEAWAVDELRYVQLGDARLNKRLMKVVGTLASHAASSVPEACDSWAETKGVYRLWDSPRVTPQAIRQAHRQSTVERLEGLGEVLVIQDTTSLDVTHRPATKGVGPLDRPSRQGVKVHSGLAVSTQGVPLGLVYQQDWVRDPDTVGKKHKRRQLETKDKESQRWLSALEATQELIPQHTTVVTVADREADIYDLWATPRRPGSELLIRVSHNRRVKHQALYLWDAVLQSPVQGELSIQLNRSDNRPPREATLAVRYTKLAIRAPAHRESKEHLEPVQAQVILAQEENPPKAMTPVRWLLFTTLPVRNCQDAIVYLRWYSYRWLVERYHYVLKSGCNIEKLQLEEVDRLVRALATYCIVAWRLLWLTYEARQNPDSPCDSVLQVHEWQSLYCTVNNTPVPPKTPPTLHEAVRWIAQLGGFLGRRHDGEPGVKTIWRGLRRLNDIAETWKLLNPDSSTNHLRLVGKA
tara:strand:+ start:126 stop:1535 length:1410 start_codon:yes stop_codon:yes gene_type:complete